MKFDLEKTAELDRLFRVPRDERDEAWVEAFYAAVPDASLATRPEGQVVRGPDGYPYFRLAMPEPATEFETFCVTHVLDHCLANGFGIVIGDVDEPEWVFPYGNLWSFKETGRFVVATGEQVPPSGEVLVGSPADDMLPPYAREVLRRELVAQGAENPSVLAVNAPGASPEWFLSFEPMPNPERLLWYIPPHLGLVAMGPDWPEPMRL